MGCPSRSCKAQGWPTAVLRLLPSVERRDLLPRVDDLFDHVGNARFFSSLGLANDYWQVPVHQADRENTAFVTPDRLYQFRQMSFGLCNAPAMFQRLVDRVLGNLKWAMCVVCMDDVLIYGSDFDEHLSRVDCMLSSI